MQEVFVSFPWGVPFDTMEMTTARGNNVEYNQRVGAGNQMLAAYQEALKNLKPGETKWVRGDEHGLDIEFRRRAEGGVAGTTAAGETNPLLAQLGAHVQLAG